MVVKLSKVKSNLIKLNKIRLLLICISRQREMIEMEICGRNIIQGRAKQGTLQVVDDVFGFKKVVYFFLNSMSLVT